MLNTKLNKRINMILAAIVLVVLALLYGNEKKRNEKDKVHYIRFYGNLSKPKFYLDEA
jgi:hypothetical protein